MGADPVHSWSKNKLKEERESAEWAKQLARSEEPVRGPFRTSRASATMSEPMGLAPPPPVTIGRGLKSRRARHEINALRGAALTAEGLRIWSPGDPRPGVCGQRMASGTVTLSSGVTTRRRKPTSGSDE